MDFSTAEQNLKSRGYIVTIFQTVSEAVEYLNVQIDNQVVGFGGSMTLEQMKLYEILETHNTIFWHQRLPEGRTNKEIRLAANHAAIYVSSVNGLAETGEFEIILIDEELGY